MSSWPGWGQYADSSLAPSAVNASGSTPMSAGPPPTQVFTLPVYPLPQAWAFCQGLCVEGMLRLRRVRAQPEYLQVEGQQVYHLQG